MLEAFGLGFAVQISLILCGLVVFYVKTPSKVVGAFGGLGAGLLLGAIAIDLLPSAESLSHVELAGWMLSGAAIFVVADRVVERRFGDEGGSASLGIVIGSVIDGVPESLIFGIQLAAGIPLSISFLVAVFVSNIPQALAPSADMVATGWSKGRLVGLWAVVAVACGIAALIGWGVATIDPSATGDRASALAIGGVLAMLTNSLMPFSYERGKVWAGVFAVVGFIASVAMG
jgi:zinc transporter, ZIP family